MSEIKRALVLGAGAIKGAFQVGAIAEVLAHGFVPDAIYGVSIGALNGAFLVDRAGRAAKKGFAPNWPSIGEELVEFWHTRIRCFEDIGRKKGAPRLLVDIAFSSFDGLVDMSKLCDLVRREIRVENIAESPVRLRAGVFNLATATYYEIDPSETSCIEYIIASTAEPILMPCPVLQGHPYTDGGLKNVSPIKGALDDKARELVCILCQAEEISDRGFNHKNLAELADRIVEVVINQAANRDLEIALAINKMCPEDNRVVDVGPFHDCRRAEFTIIRPQEPLCTHILDFRERDICKMIDLGRSIAQERLSRSEPRAAARA